ncbi:MAG: arsenate reductase ArsC [Bifidobacterium crudilactis]|nr:arsenate reductase ArsC [Bifidobacterium crudilactis]MCI1889756.1 arsenate reductase ArsC [Bifidobacterium crudilactis]
MSNEQQQDATVVAFVCTRNACRSQIAEAWANKYASEGIRTVSAGTHPDGMVDPGAVRIMRSSHGIDLSGKHPKRLEEVGGIDVLVTMGCGVACPYVSGARLVEWDIPDPMGGSDEAYDEVVEVIRSKVKDLTAELGRRQ